eukprot:CAMPEP_0119482016 /NCGR_PEP_ID=MMETSP1344-20130328/10075_1 /TAXON_ID=236787 /ORGANISM="Florenciella parvula, Strain CCMP2471" /LENGTH=90 /DNA_ID=CAMNT_0007516401 /DNA_START=606 /DNA_END=875 /DNA_ORIENTATION=+
MAAAGSTVGMAFVGGSRSNTTSTAASSSSDISSLAISTSASSARLILARAVSSLLALLALLAPALCSMTPAHRGWSRATRSRARRTAELR